MPRRVYSVKFYDPTIEKKFNTFLETLSGESINEKLNAFWETYLAPKDPAEYGAGLDKMKTTFFTPPCNPEREAVLISELPCVEDHNPNFQCRIKPECFETLKAMIPASWWRL